MAIPVAVVIATFLIAMAPLRSAAAEASQPGLRRFDIAQTSMGAPDPSAQPVPSAPAPSAPGPRLDYIPPMYKQPAQPAPSQPESSAELAWGAIGFTADGSWSSVWKMSSQAEAEAAVAKKCAAFGRGGCEVVSFSGQQCVALATFIGSYSRRRWQLSFTAGGDTYPEAQSAALGRCNADERTRGNCQHRTAACADGR